AMPVLDEKRVYLASFDGKVYALTVATGKLVWTYTVGSPVFGGVALYKKRLYAVGMNTGVHAIAPKDGTPVWRSTVFGDKEWRNPVTIVNDVIYTVTRKGTLVALSVPDGKELWRKDLGGETYFAPIVRRGKIYLGTTDGWFYCIR